MIGKICKYWIRSPDEVFTCLCPDGKFFCTGLPCDEAKLEPVDDRFPLPFAEKE